MFHCQKGRIVSYQSSVDLRAKKMAVTTEVTGVDLREINDWINGLVARYNIEEC